MTLTATQRHSALDSQLQAISDRLDDQTLADATAESLIACYDRLALLMAQATGYWPNGDVYVAE